jgi:hypothetical protein
MSLSGLERREGGSGSNEYLKNCTPFKCSINLVIHWAIDWTGGISPSREIK